MVLFTTQENRIKCGRCNTGFDLNKNMGGCPLCGFGKKAFKESVEEIIEHLLVINNNPEKRDTKWCPVWSI